VSPGLEGCAAISGIGQSDVGRRLERDPLALTVDACLAAIDDAGLRREDVDGLSTYPGSMGAGAPGFSGAGVQEVQDALRLELDWFCGGPELPGQLGSVINACMAVATGLAKHVLCFRTVWESTAQRGGRRAGIGAGGGSGFRATGFLQWSLPFGAASAANWVALFAQRHFHEYGTTREQLGQIALNARRNAAHNPRAVYRDPLTLDDYLSARPISTPLGLLDCDVPVDGSTACVVSRRELVRDLRRPAVVIEAVGSALHGRPSWDQFDDLTSMAARDAARMLWSRTTLRPSDVRVAQLYDGFSFLALAWLEALGFCGKGEGGAFVEGGSRIALAGELPLNTGGGQLSGGRLHGYGLLHEAVLQLRGDGGARQVPGDPRVAVATAGGGPLGGCLLLSRP
jgi:acetyl-CoA acetyltransferase